MKHYYEEYWSEDGFRPTGMTTPFLANLYQSNIPQGSKCLDVGCGDGRTSGIWLRDHGHSYIGVDVSDVAVREAQSVGLDARTIDDASRLPFQDHAFDACVCIEVLEHLFQPHLAVGEIFRTLRPGGVAIITVPNVSYWCRRVEHGLFGRFEPLGDDLASAEPWRAPHIRFFTARSLQRMLDSVGFDPVVVGGHYGGVLRYLPFFYRKAKYYDSSNMYRYLERKVPSLLGYRLHAVAIRP